MTDASVVIPTYNRAFYIRSAIDSALRDHNVRHVIVVDDGSIDATDALLSRHYAHNNRVIYIKTFNGGASRARNIGLAAVQTKYLTFLDSDDIMAEGSVTTRLRVLEETDNGDFCYGISLSFTDSPDHTGLPVGESPSDPSRVPGAFLNGFPFPICSPLYRTSLCHKVGGFAEDLTRYEDWLFNFTASLNSNTLLFVPVVVAFVRHHSTVRLSAALETPQHYFQYLRHIGAVLRECECADYHIWRSYFFACLRSSCRLARAEDTHSATHALRLTQTQLCPRLYSWLSRCAAVAMMLLGPHTIAKMYYDIRAGSDRLRACRGRVYTQRNGD